jgi:CheY-like chemotaxis protein
MKKILIAEDDFFIRDIYTRAFSLSNYEAEVATDGAEAMDKIKSNTYDLILLDIMMPKFTGIEVLKMLRNLDSPVKETPVYIITNLGQKDILDDLFKKGIDGYIIKSEVTPKQLIEEVDSFFAKKENPVQL